MSRKKKVVTDDDIMKGEPRMHDPYEIINEQINAPPEIENINPQDGKGKLGMDITQKSRYKHRKMDKDDTAQDIQLDIHDPNKSINDPINSPPVIKEINPQITEVKKNKSASDKAIFNIKNEQLPKLLLGSAVLTLLFLI